VENKSTGGERWQKHIKEQELEIQKEQRKSKEKV